MAECAEVRKGQEPTETDNDRNDMNASSPSHQHSDSMIGKGH